MAVETVLSRRPARQMILLRPHLFGFRNRLRRSLTSFRHFRLELVVVAAVSLVMGGIYSGIVRILSALSNHADFDVSMLAKLVDVFFIGFFFLLIFSSFISALGAVYSAKDLPLLLATPVSRTQIFLAKTVETAFSSSWMFFVLWLPLAFALAKVFHFPPSFFADVALVSFLFVVLTASIGMIFATLFVNFFPLSRVGDLVIVVILVAAGVFIVYGQDVEHFSRSTRNAAVELDMDRLQWIPIDWFSAIALRYLHGMSEYAVRAYALLGSLSLAVLLLSRLVFARFFMSGYSRSTESGGRPSGRRLSIRAKPADHRSSLPRDAVWSDNATEAHLPAGFLRRFPFLPDGRQMRTLMAKEAKLFFRDPSQAFQLSLILMLTFLYLHNFRTLEGITNFSSESRRWWESFLCVGNVFMGASVSSAIATRFVFPAISLEGRAYYLLRVTPLSVRDFLWSKFLAWLLPVGILTTVLLFSGALAVQANGDAIAITVLLGFAVTIGIVGLGVGAGAVYAKFDWDSPTQVTSSFGSLVYMLLSVGLILMTLFPAAFLFIAVTVPAVFANERPISFFTSLFCAFFLAFFVNVSAARTALNAGQQALIDLERD